MADDRRSRKYLVSSAVIPMGVGIDQVNEIIPAKFLDNNFPVIFCKLNRIPGIDHYNSFLSGNGSNRFKIVDAGPDNDYPVANSYNFYQIINFIIPYCDLEP